MCYIYAMKNKSNPVGIRFDLEKLEFVKIREKLETNQQVVNFLMNKYWWDYKVNTPTHKDIPPTSNNEKFFESQSTLKNKVELSTNTPPHTIDPINYQEKFNNCEFENEYKALWEEIKADINLTPNEKAVWKSRLNAK